ncbi:MAG TPA: SDR family oxidoreductase [Solirubrobacterales bacterium]|nr:SDR family oxidoreductase [Solirubrobacterales bacterium]
MQEFADKVTLITGAGGGIGTACATRVVESGGKVLLHDLVAGDRLIELAEALGDQALVVTADLTRPAALDDLWREALAWQGHIDVLINNAGIYEPAEVDGDMSDWLAAWERTLAICLVSPATLCRAAIRTFRDQPEGGIIVNLASRAAWRGEDPDYWHYAAAKAGVVAMTKTIARQYGREGVTAFAVAPGFVNTSFNDSLVERYGLEMFEQDSGLGEVAAPEDLANVIVFLASGRARHATGTTIDVNGASYVR